MMSEVFLFIPKAELDARENVDNFINRCRDDLTVFGGDLNWDSWRWNGIVSFTKVGSPSQGVGPQHYLAAEIQPFAKAYIRYQQGHKPTKNIQEIKAIRCIEPALLKIRGTADVTQIDVAVLDEAAVMARENYKSSAYHAGAHLEILAKFLSHHEMVPKVILWKNPISRYKDKNKTGKLGDAERERRLPSDVNLEYMAEMFANDLQDPRDRYTTSMFALGMCAPGRVSEFQDLSVDCLHQEKDRNGEMRLGIRFYSGKGYGADIKWISTPFVSIAKEAINRLRVLSSEGRKLAKWYEEQPHRFYRHSSCPDVEEDEALTAAQISEAMGWSVSDGIQTYQTSRKWLFALRDEAGIVTLRHLNKYIHSRLPIDWPWKNKERGIKYSDALLCMRENELHGNRGVSRVLLWTVNSSAFTFDLGPRKTGNHSSIWQRHGYTNADGSEIKLTSHQLRHLLNTVAQRGDLGQFDIAMWSGRASVRQNRTYNHMSERELLNKVKGQVGIETLMGPLDKIKNRAPVTVKDLDAIGEGIAHVTEFGFCVHDFSMLPCQKHRDCINCTEQVCIKGDDEKLSRLIAQRDRTRAQMKKAEDGMTDGYYGADRWYEHQKQTVERTDELIRLLDSNDIEDGAIIRLRNNGEYSALKREMSAKLAESEEIKRGPNMAELRALLGGDVG